MDETSYRRVAVSLERVAGQLEHLYDSQRARLVAEELPARDMAPAELDEWLRDRSRAWGEVNGLYAAHSVVLTELHNLRMEAAGMGVRVPGRAR